MKKVFLRWISPNQNTTFTQFLQKNEFSQINIIPYLSGAEFIGESEYELYFAPKQIFAEI